MVKIASPSHFNSQSSSNSVGGYWLFGLEQGNARQQGSGGALLSDLDAVPEQSWLLKLRRKPAFRGQVCLSQACPGFSRCRRVRGGTCHLGQSTSSGDLLCNLSLFGPTGVSGWVARVGP